jgi:hypothetical protein
MSIENFALEIQTSNSLNNEEIKLLLKAAVMSISQNIAQRLRASSEFEAKVIAIVVRDGKSGYHYGTTVNNDRYAGLREWD